MKNKKFIAVLTVVFAIGILRSPFIVADFGIDSEEVLEKAALFIGVIVGEEEVEGNKSDKCELRLIGERIRALINDVRVIIVAQKLSPKKLKELDKVLFVVNRFDNVSDEDLLKIQEKMNPKDLRRLLKMVKFLERVVRMVSNSGFCNVVDVGMIDPDIPVKSFAGGFGKTRLKEMGASLKDVFGKDHFKEIKEHLTEVLSGKGATAVVNVVKVSCAVLGLIGGLLLTILL